MEALLSVLSFKDIPLIFQVFLFLPIIRLKKLAFISWNSFSSSLCLSNLKCTRLIDSLPILWRTGSQELLADLENRLKNQMGPFVNDWYVSVHPAINISFYRHLAKILVTLNMAFLKMWITRENHGLKQHPVWNICVERHNVATIHESEPRFDSAG